MRFKHKGKWTSGPEGVCVYCSEVECDCGDEADVALGVALPEKDVVRNEEVPVMVLPKEEE